MLSKPPVLLHKKITIPYSIIYLLNNQIIILTTDNFCSDKFTNLPFTAVNMANAVDMRCLTVKTSDSLVALLKHRVPPGVYPASKKKADYLGALLRGEATSQYIEQRDALKMLASMGGGKQYHANDHSPFF